jgi:hypothetical protein
MILLERTKIDHAKHDTKILKQLKQLIRSATGERLILRDGDWIILCYSGSKIIGMCCVTHRSPERHFPNEESENTLIPYLYNYVCDFKHKSKKPSVAIMKYIMEFYRNIYTDLTNTMETLHMNDTTQNQINLDVRQDNIHAQKFFERNDFKKIADYQNSSGQYYSYTKAI